MEIPGCFCRIEFGSMVQSRTFFFKLFFGRTRIGGVDFQIDID